jgi:hypothetical protein
MALLDRVPGTLHAASSLAPVGVAPEPNLRQ